MSNKDYKIGELFNNNIFAEFNSCPIYSEDKIVGKEYWSIQLIFFRGTNIPAKFCLRLYKGKYNGEGLLDSNMSITRISMINPEYIILPDTHYNLNKEEVIKFFNIMSNNWNMILSILNEEIICIDNDPTFLTLQMPDYNLLPIQS